MILKELEIEGQMFDVDVSEGGAFTIFEHGSTERSACICRSARLGDAEADARSRLKGKRAHVKVPFIDIRTGDGGVAYSIHAGNGNVMAQFEGQRGHYHGGAGVGVKVLDPGMPAAMLERYRTILSERDMLEEERRAIEREHSFDLRDRVWKAIRETNDTDGLESSLAM